MSSYSSSISYIKKNTSRRRLSPKVRSRPTNPRIKKRVRDSSTFIRQSWNIVTKRRKTIKTRPQPSAYAPACDPKTADSINSGFRKRSNCRRRESGYGLSKRQSSCRRGQRGVGFVIIASRSKYDPLNRLTLPVVRYGHAG